MTGSLDEKAGFLYRDRNEKGRDLFSRAADFLENPGKHGLLKNLVKL